MKLSEYITQIDDKDKKNPVKSLIAVVYENYRVIGLTAEVKSAVERYKVTSGIDLLNQEVATNHISSAYGNIPQTYFAGINKVVETPEEEVVARLEE